MKCGVEEREYGSQRKTELGDATRIGTIWSPDYDKEGSLDWSLGSRIHWKMVFRREKFFPTVWKNCKLDE